ncbi:MAG TPA: hypothetical protein VD907_00465 [Verrucomicrobiae bacterium]|nr:hypothetical protein [Verrucomicrobiae bacterium]
MVASKKELFDLPIMKRHPKEDDVFVGQAWWCSENPLTPDECTFLTISTMNRNGPRPECPKHPNASTTWCNIYEIDGVKHRYHFGAVD